MCGQLTAYITYATLSYTDSLFLGFSGYTNALKEIIFTIQSVLWRFRKVYYTSEFRFRGVFLLYRKFLKSSEMVYNELEIKNYMTKERMCWIRHDVVYEVFCFGLGYLHYLTMEKE